MLTFVPSQVVEYLDERLPAVKQQQAGAMQSIELPRDYAGAIKHVVAMINGIPGDLLTLRGSAAGEFFEALQTARVAVDLWTVGQGSHMLGPMAGRGGWNPLTFIRKHLQSLPDEGPGARAADLEFVSDEMLRSALAVDLRSTDGALERGAWKAATLLAGSVMEALLLDALTGVARADVDAAVDGWLKADAANRNPGREMEQWSVHPMIEIALALKILTSETAAQCRIAKDFRNLIHPGRARRLQQECDRGTALATVGAVEHVVRDLRRHVTRR